MQQKIPQEKLRDIVKAYFPHFREIYSSEAELLEYWLKFYEVFDSERTLAEFLRLLGFYRALKMVKADFVKLIMIISLIEKLNSEEDYIDFGVWLSKQRKSTNSEKCCRQLLQEWNNTHGCSHKFRNFFKNPEYISKTEQITLLKSVVGKNESSPTFVPLFCYDETKCKKFYSKEIRVYEACPVFQDERVLNKGITYFANFLYYNLRNKFVHDAKIIQLPDETDFLWDYENEVQTVRGKYTGLIGLSLKSKTLEELLNRNFKKLLHNYVEARRQSST